MRLLLLPICLLATFSLYAKNILVKNIEDLKKANKEAKPGDIISLQNGEWNNVTIELDCTGTALQPIVFKAQTAGKVLITGHSNLLIGGEHITVDGLYFTKGYAGNTAVIQFRNGKKNVANHCRVTNTVIDGFNNPQRLEENNWVLFYGKNNRLDHCTIQDKQNMGVTIAVILDDERSRENFHSIDHNYFGFRIPLGSNGGETIRVGVSQHCEFNSNTQIVNNFFEHCDGETEIVSIKSGANTLRNNLFKECSGSLVLRHGNNNIVENNIFLGNGKDGSGGVRVINKGQWVVNNLFYQLRGSGFRSPLAVMNGVPNSPAHRYVAAQDAVIANNTWYQCEPLSFCEGSDQERSETPKNIVFLNNIVYGNRTTLYKSFDKMNGFHFAGNLANADIQQNPGEGFTKATLKNITIQKTSFPVSTGTGSAVPDSIAAMAPSKLEGSISTTPGFYNIKKMEAVLKNAKDSCGVAWLAPVKKGINKLTFTCKDGQQLAEQLSKTAADITIIRLTGTDYEFTQPLEINSNIEITTSSSRKIRFSSKQKITHLFEVNGGAMFNLSKLNLDLSGLNADNFVISDKDANTRHLNIILQKNTFSGFNGTFFNASKTSQIDSMVISQNNFSNNKGNLFHFMNETDKKGYYNVERMFINNNKIAGQQGQVLSMLRGGNDESTMGPRVWFNKNVLINCNAGNRALIHYHGTQYSSDQNNTFINSNAGGTLILYEDVVKATHLFSNNILQNSGAVRANEYTTQSNNKN